MIKKYGWGGVSCAPPGFYFLCRAGGAAGRGHPAVCVAHRLSSIADIDRIVVLRDGKIVGEGDFATLLNTNEYFAELYRASQKSKT